MHIKLRECQLEKIVEAHFAANNCDVRGHKLFMSVEGNNNVFGCDVHYDGEIDIEASLKPKPSPASDALAIQVDVLKAKYEMAMAAVEAFIKFDDENGCVNTVVNYDDAIFKARAVKEMSKS